VHQLRRLVAYLKSSRIDVLHTHDFYTNVFGMAAGALARLPVRIASLRETEGMRTRNQLKVQRIAYSLAHQIVANCNAVRIKLTDDKIRAERVSVIYNGLDFGRLVTTNTRREILQLLGVPIENESRRFVTIVANMRHEVKDYPMFLKSARRVMDVFPDCGFLLAGEGHLSQGLQSFAHELGIRDSVFFLGRCEKLAELLSVSDVCVLSSKAEGFSNSILEYMAAARPVVATEVGGAAEAIRDGETGYLVASGNDELMASRLLSLLRDPAKAEQMGQAGRRVVEQKFSCEAQLARTEDLYERLLAERSRRH
jgi:glycosyltransferase involved in cell wall biosynthesis